jgi:L-iditol 2-dehydrogenase
MRIAELYALHKFRQVDSPVPAPGPGQVQVHVEAVGICGSDLHNFTEGQIGDVPCHYPMVLGHEPAGVVVGTGAGVTGWAPGDRAALEPALYCYHCEFCRSGRHNLCANIRFLSALADPGFFREFVNLPARNLLPLPNGVGFKEGALFEPLAVALHSMQFAALGPRETAVVFGAGPIGLLTLIVLKLCGAGRVWVVEPVAHRRELAKLVGADAVIDPHAEDAAGQILKDTGQRGVDLAVDCAARENTVNLAIQAVRNGGRVVITGIPVEHDVALEFHVARRKELAIYNVRRSSHESEAALEILGAHAALFAPILTHTLPLEKVQPAFEMLETYSGGAVKVILQP